MNSTISTFCHTTTLFYLTHMHKGKNWVLSPETTKTMLVYYTSAVKKRNKTYKIHTPAHKQHLLLCKILYCQVWKSNCCFCLLMQQHGLCVYVMVANFSIIINIGERVTIGYLWESIMTCYKCSVYLGMNWIGIVSALYHQFCFLKIYTDTWTLNHCSPTVCKLWWLQ